MVRVRVAVAITLDVIVEAEEEEIAKAQANAQVSKLLSDLIRTTPTIELVSLFPLITTIER